MVSNSIEPLSLAKGDSDALSHKLSRDEWASRFFRVLEMLKQTVKSRKFMDERK